MTMRVTITNADVSGRVAHVQVEDFDHDKPGVADEFTLGKGEARSVYIHAARRVIVTEDPLAEVPAPGADENAKSVAALERAALLFDGVEDAETAEACRELARGIRNECEPR